jgi:uncharacterized membrane protein HdeD (DUF308 family)
MLANQGALGHDVVRRHWVWFFALGILLLILGLIATGLSLLATLVSVVIIGWLLFVSGVLHIAHAFRVRDWGGFFLELLIGVLDLVVGGMLVIHPAAGALTLTLVVAAFFIIGGLYQIIQALFLRLPNWGWALISGLVSVLLGVLLWTEWPVSGLWFIGFCVGIGLIFRGLTWLIVALTARSLPPAAAS